MEELTYANMTPSISSLSTFSTAPRRIRSFRLHMGDEMVKDSEGNYHAFDLIWFQNTQDLIAVEFEEKLGTVLPKGFQLKRYTDNYTYLGKFFRQEIDDLLEHKGNILSYLWTERTRMLGPGGGK